MRVIHTADWHLGKTLYGRDRTDEEVSVLSFLKDFIKENKVELLIIAGDLFDKFIPSARAEGVLHNFLAEIHHLGTKVVMIAGNHDSGVKLTSFSHILKILDVYSFGKTGKDTYVQFKNRDDEPVFIAAVPFIRESEVLDIGDYKSPEHIIKSKYADRMGAVFHYFENMFIDDGINILTTHILVGGASISGTEHKFYLANSYAVPPLLLPNSASYIACGHIHKYQRLDTPSPAYYSGSLFPIDFGEQDEKGFIFFEVRAGLPIENFEFIKTPHKELVTLKIRREEIPSIIEKYKAFDGYLKIILDIQGEDVRLLIDKIKSYLPQVLSIQVEKKIEEKRKRLTMDDILDPIKSYISYYKEKKGRDPKPELIDTFKELYRKVTEYED